MEVLVAVLGHQGDPAGDRVAEPSVLDQLDRGLEAAAEPRVRRAAEPHAGFAGNVQQCSRVLQRRSERLLAPDVLAGAHCREARLDVRLRRGQVHHQLDLPISEQLVR
jgi:hypothetical protein